VLVVTNLWPVDGGFQGIFVSEQVDALRRLGHHVDVEVVARGGRGTRDYLTAGPRVRRRVRHGGYDVVHVHYGLTALAGSFAAPVPRVLSLHGSDINTPWQRRCTKLGWRGYAARIYVSRRLADTAGDPAGHVIPAGVDFELFTPGDRIAARAALGIPADEKVILFGGAPSNTVKGYDVFTGTLTALRSRLPSVSSHAPAAGSATPSVPSSSAVSSRAPVVRELVLAEPGQERSAVVAKMVAADALLFTSRKGAEGSPMVVKEAAAMGLPVVTVDVGDVAQVLAGVSPSAVVPFPEPWGGAGTRAALIDALADRLAEVLATPARSNGRERIARLDSLQVAQRVVAVYRQAIAAREGRLRAGTNI
jgi:glycosyltransferase involved in cell wall biosynthesis